MENHEERNEENDRPLLLDMEEVENENDPIEAAQYSQQRKKTSYTLKRKLEVVKFAKKFGNYAAAKKYSIGRTTIISWVQNKEKLSGEVRKLVKAAAMSRLSGGGRPQLSKDLNQKVLEWIQNCRARKERVSRRLIQVEALKIGQSMDRASELEPGQ
uniref:HTH psq-type domain-containing protein n=1 Tax=Plectus sambesii TaxID=2011161 RepID=A0A914XDZ0_9BILA